MEIRKHVLTSICAAALTLLVAPAAMAQESTVEATPGGPSEGYPVAIHEGTCDNPSAEPAWQLDDALSIGVGQEDPEVVGAEVTRPVAATSGALDVSFDDLTGSEYVVAVHASPDEFGTLAACGGIAGIVEDGKLVIALAPVGASGVSGVAILDRDDAGFLDLGEDQTQLSAYIVVPGDEDEATPVS
jgi:hypothetical protein